jgi:hypothetical protein
VYFFISSSPFFFFSGLPGRRENLTRSGNFVPVEVGIPPFNFDDLAKSLLDRHPGESRGPEHLEITGFRLLPE